jgi:hypothetical protein
MSEGVSVTYHYNPNTAEVMIRVELVENNGSEQIQVTPALPQFSPGEWEVTFHLVPGQGITELKFDETDGIFINSNSPRVRIRDSHFVDDKHWIMKLKNELDKNFDSANVVNYTINGTADEVHIAGDLTTFSHDPTIAVTTDPIGG